MLHALNQQRTLTYAEKTIWIKGLITSARISDIVFSQTGQQLSVPHFMPLTGLSSAMIESMQALIRKPPSTFTDDDYSQGFALSNVVLQNVEADYTQDVAQSAPSVDFDSFVAWYKQEDVIALMETIIATAQKDTVSGKIL